MGVRLSTLFVRSLVAGMDAARAVPCRRSSRRTASLETFGDALEQAFSLAGLAHRLATEIRSGLELTWVRVCLDVTAGGGTVQDIVGVAGSGMPRGARTVELRHGDEVLGRIEHGPKSRGRWTRADERLIVMISCQAASAFYNNRLVTDRTARIDELQRHVQELTRSRKRIVHTQALERRRWERSLHDGIQQEVLALIIRMRLLRRHLEREHNRARLDELREDAYRILDSLRELSRGIYPAVLSDHGLAAAVEEQVSRLPVVAKLTVDPALRQRRFEEDVEACAYFVVTEALSNMLKHAKADRLTIRLTLRTRMLEVEVVDDGVGFVLADAPGTGLAGIRDRVHALQGRLHVVSASGVGTRVLAELPIGVANADIPAQGGFRQGPALRRDAESGSDGLLVQRVRVSQEGEDGGHSSVHLSL